MPSISVLVGDSLEKRLQRNVAKYNITQCNLCYVLSRCHAYTEEKHCHLTLF